MPSYDCCEPPRADASAMLDLRGVWAHYAGRCALEDVSLRLGAGERVAVVGPNGAGKSTMFKVIAGTHSPSAGSVSFYGSDPGRHVCIAYIEQRADINWRFPVTVEDVVAMGRIARVRYFRYLGRKDRVIVADAMERVAIANLRSRQIGELSGGQQRRMFIARALAQEAEIMLLDEPYAGLDADASRMLSDTLDTIGDSIAVMVATHDLGIAEHLGRVVLLNRRLIAAGTPDEVLAPEHLAGAYGGNLRRIDGAGSGYALPTALPITRSTVAAPLRAG
ncbi:MAG: metal ABC transporter ATP-binding protein [Spirochaetaceae bacterium]|nr:metal ABC transporter ATP-binding protein [Spirochaetaceae bacterium]